jgi:hypothetical protein
MKNGLGTGLTFEEVMECVRRENEYAKGWNKGDRKVSRVEGIDDGDVHSGTTGPVGQPFGIADWHDFAGKYFEEIPKAMASYTPDGGSVRIRIIKVIALLVRCLMIYGRPSDLERLAGKSSSDFPILAGGIKAFDALSNNHGCLVPTPETRSLRNESPSCDPLK